MLGSCLHFVHDVGAHMRGFIVGIVVGAVLALIVQPSIFPDGFPAAVQQATRDLLGR